MIEDIALFIGVIVAYVCFTQIWNNKKAIENLEEALNKNHQMYVDLIPQLTAEKVIHWRINDREFEAQMERERQVRLSRQEKADKLREARAKAKKK